MLESATKDEYGAPCQDGENIILFLTDGQPTVGVKTFDELKTIIDGYGIDVTVFTYGFGSGVDTSILLSLSCEYSGVYLQIDGSSSSS